MMKTPILIPLLATFFAVSLSFGQTTYTFNSAGQLASEFTVANDDTAQNWSQQASGGLSDSGTVQIGSAGNALSSAMILNQGQSTAMETFSVSTYFQARESSTVGYHLMMGLIPSTDALFSVGGSGSDPKTGVVQLGMGLRRGSTGYQFAWMSNDTRGLISGTQSLTGGEWYWISADFSRVDDQWTIDMVLRESNAAGDLGSVVISNTHQQENSAILEGDSLHAMFAIANSPELRVVDRIDNFSISVIPEPSAMAALFGGIVLAVALLRNRRRR